MLVAWPENGVGMSVVGILEGLSAPMTTLEITEEQAGFNLHFLSV